MENEKNAIYRVESVGGMQFIGQVTFQSDNMVKMIEAFQLIQGLSPQGMQLLCAPYGDFTEVMKVVPASVVRASKEETGVYTSARAGMAGIVLAH